MAENGVFFEDVILAAWTASSVSLAERLGFRPVSELKGAEKSVPVYVASMSEILQQPELTKFIRLSYLYSVHANA